MNDYEVLLNRAKDLHGEVCPGVIMGTRMSIAAMKKLNMDPLEPNENLIVTVETDRCMPDAIQAITGCTVGRRTLKCRDYGKFVATFVDMTTGEAVRVSAKDDLVDSTPGLWTWFKNVAELAKEKNMPKVMEEKKSAIKKLSEMPDEDLLSLVELQIDDTGIPGIPQHIVTCSVCGEHVMDKKEIIEDGKPVCQFCAD
ncbi:FmdE family protein [Methanobacterium sp. MBAC-LM]|uniref:FmdE family protein n=1 Tax=Methanobacterium sp. MBAC-LM TaxID=3412034 RepID=UPI003C715508